MARSSSCCTRHEPVNKLVGSSQYSHIGVTNSFMNLPPIPTGLIGSLQQYNAKPITGEETLDVLLRTKEQAIRMVNDEFAKPINNRQSWSTLLTHWVVNPSEAYNVWSRQGIDVNSVEDMFEILISRKKVSSTLYNDIVYKHLVELAKPKSCDQHFIEMHKHHTKLFDDCYGPALSVALNDNIQFDTILEDNVFARGTGLIQAEAIRARIETIKDDILKKAKAEFVEKHTRLELQALVLADPSLLDYLDRDQSPADANSTQLTNWFQSKILRGAPNGPFHIALKTNPNGVSPLSKVPIIVNNNTNTVQTHGVQNVVNQPIINNTNSNIQNHKMKKQKMTQHHQQPTQFVPNNNKVRKVNQSQQPGTQQPSPNVIIKKKPRKFCAFCKTTYPKSKTCDSHYPEKCYRNPQSASYDQAKAAVLPTN